MPHWASILLCGAFGTGMLVAIVLLVRLEPIEDPAVQVLVVVFGAFYLLAFAGCYSALDPNWDTTWDTHSIEGCSKKTTIRPGKFRSAISWTDVTHFSNVAYPRVMMIEGRDGSVIYTQPLVRGQDTLLAAIRKYAPYATEVDFR